MAGLAEFEPSSEQIGWKESFELVELLEPRVLDTWVLETHELHEILESPFALNYSVSRQYLFVSVDSVEQILGPWR